MRPGIPLLALQLAVAGCAGAPRGGPADVDPFLGGPRLSVAYPADGSQLGGPPSAFVAGRVAAGMERGERIDLVFAIDTSSSTCEPVGGTPAEEETGCGAAGTGTGAQPGRVLDVELAAARALLGRLDPALARVGVVSFGAAAPIQYGLHRFQGPDSGFLGTQLELAPSADFAAVERSLGELAARGSAGATNVAGALGRATQVLQRAPDPAGRRLVVLLTDGIPTAPRYTDRENLVETLRAADRAAHQGVRVLSFAIGDAAAQPAASLEIAERTGGAFYPVRDAAALPNVFQAVQLDQIGELEVVNTTTGEPAIHSRIGADGSWDAVVPLVPGPNALAIRAFSETGEEALRELRVDYRPEAASPALPADLEARRTAARAEELAILASQVDALERRAVARKRAQLLAEISRSRAAARSAAETQRRELALELEAPGVGAGPP